jgi:threonine dehydrogenase-like Zn-dependent dehydrogenase
LETTANSTNRTIRILSFNEHFMTSTVEQLTERRMARLFPNGQVEVVREPAVSPGKGEVLVRMRASLISPGTHLSGARQNRRMGNCDPGSKSRTFGYQGAGEVIAAGPDVGEWVAVGDRVACMGPGALHTDLAVVPVRLAVPLPDNVTYEQGAYCHLAATALWAIRRGRPNLGEYVFIAGLGVVGQIAAQLARLAGAYVMASDALPARLAKASELGAAGTCQVGVDDVPAAARSFTHESGFDMAVVAFGGEVPDLLKNIHDLMQLTPDGHREGRIVVVGGLRANTSWAVGMGNVDVLSAARTGPGYHDPNWEHGQSHYPYPWVRWGTHGNLTLILRLISEGRLQVDPLTTHRVDLDHIGDVVEALLEHPNEALGCIVRS